MQRQSGITLIGFVIILIVGAFFVYTAMKLVPPYMDYLNVSKALSTVATQSTSGSLTVPEVQRALQTQQITQYFGDADIAGNNISVATVPNGGTVLKLAYDKKVHWLYNIDFLIHFEKSVPLKLQSQG